MDNVYKMFLWKETCSLSTMSLRHNRQSKNSVSEEFAGVRIKNSKKEEEEREEVGAKHERKKDLRREEKNV
jgi:hypothetical protein